MAKKLYPEENIQAIASAIRAKNGSSDTYTIGEMAQAIEDIPAGDGVFKAATIGTTFNGYKDIGEVNVPDGVTSIANNAFDTCTKLTSIDIPYGVTSIGSSSFSKCSSLESIDIPNSVTNIASSAFFGCTKLTSVNIPSSITSIKNSVFKGCTKLTSVNIPNGVTIIENAAFYECSSLASIDIPESVTNIGNSVFDSCSKLLSITCRAINPPALGGSMTFAGVPATANIYVPAESVEAYKAAQYWSVRASYIQAIPSEG